MESGFHDSFMPMEESHVTQCIVPALSLGNEHSMARNHDRYSVDRRLVCGISRRRSQQDVEEVRSCFSAPLCCAHYSSTAKELIKKATASVEKGGGKEKNFVVPSAGSTRFKLACNGLALGTVVCCNIELPEVERDNSPNIIDIDCYPTPRRSTIMPSKNPDSETMTL